MNEVVLRPLNAGDFQTVLEIHHRSGVHDERPWVWSMEELRDDLDDQQVVLVTDTRAALVDGAMVGYAYTYFLPSEVREERCFVFGAVEPSARRQGVGSALMHWAVQRAGDQLRSTGRLLPKFVRTASDERVVSAHRLFERCGLVPVRYFEELLRPLDDLPVPPEVDGIRIVGWPADRDHDVLEAKNAAFADHWGSTPTTAAHWAQQVRGPGARPDLSFVALDSTDRVVAHCLNKRFEHDDAVTGRRDGWIDNLGTVSAWRGRGIASALVVRSLHAFAQAGLTHALIEVDADSLTGASRLYRSLGFELVHRSVTHQLEVR